MRIKKIHVEKFKRFTDLEVKNIPESAKLVVLLGPNGCGKSSLFDAFKTWHRITAYNYGRDNEYAKKDQMDPREAHNLVDIGFYDDMSSIQQDDMKKNFILGQPIETHLILATMCRINHKIPKL